MAMTPEVTLLALAGAYLGIGVCTSVYLIASALERLDGAAKGSSLGFKLLVTPGLIAFWPLMLMRIARRAKHPPEETNAHRARAQDGGRVAAGNRDHLP
ncbi:MAG TPA: hypothetical protein VGA56_04065 [Opitutaceae bacterium]